MVPWGLRRSLLKVMNDEGISVVKNRGRLHRIRRIVQFSFLGLFLVLAWSAAYPPGAWNENAFLRFDPLAAFLAVSRSRLWSNLLPAWIILAGSFFSGRFFCGWICPLGTILDTVPSFRRRRKLFSPRPRDLPGGSTGRGERRLRFKYVFLVLLLILVLSGINLLWIFDPLVIANRDVIFVLTGSVPFVLLGLLILALLAGSRFWCREICPLGACLSLVGLAGSRLPAAASPLALVKDEKACVHCGRCSRACPFEIAEVCISERTGRLTVPDCALCGECVEACPGEGALSLRVFGKRIFASRNTGKKKEEAEPVCRR